MRLLLTLNHAKPFDKINPLQVLNKIQKHKEMERTTCVVNFEQFTPDWHMCQTSMLNSMEAKYNFSFILLKNL